MLKKRFSTVLVGNDAVEIDMLRVMLQLPSSGGAASKDAALLQVLKDCAEFLIDEIRQETGSKVVSYQQLYKKLGKSAPDFLDTKKHHDTTPSEPEPGPTSDTPPASGE